MLPDKAFPEYAFLPGHNPHPNKEGGHSYGVPEVEPLPLDSEFPFRSEEYLFSLDLYNFGFYWESHVGFEALWNKAGRTGFIADFLKALIKLGAAGIKARLKLEKAFEGHLERGYELFKAIQVNHPLVAGFCVDDLLKYTSNLKEKLSYYMDLSSSGNNILFPPLIPDEAIKWKKKS